MRVTSTLILLSFLVVFENHVNARCFWGAGGGMFGGGKGLFYMCRVFNVIILPQHTHTKYKITTSLYV